MNLICGDSIEVMAGMEPESVDAIVTDPPYGLGFMGKEWDRIRSERQGVASILRAGGQAQFDWQPSAYQEWSQRWAEAAYRVAKPSAHLLAFGGTRTVHRMTCALEDAGWIIRDMLVWGYASGFPKSKASLKPAWEPIVMARKPGPLRMLAIDECRIPTDEDQSRPPSLVAVDSPAGMGRGVEMGGQGSPLGRWPANIVLTDPIFDGGIEGVVGGGETSSGSRNGTYSGGGYRGDWPDVSAPVEGDTGTYSRFFMLPSGRSSAPSGTMGTCQTCGAPIAEPSSTARTPQPDTAPPSTATSPVAPLDPAVSDVVGLFDSPGIVIAPRGARTRRAGTPGSTASGAAQATESDTSAIDPSTSPEPLPVTSSPSGQPARTAAQSATSTDTTTTTPSLSLCERCADDAMHGRTLPQPKPTRPALPVDGDDYTRFLMVPKAARSDREPVLGGQLAPVDVFRGHQPDKPKCRTCGRQRIGPLGAPACECAEPDWAVVGDRQRENSHPTVKPVDLMRHLVRLVTPTGGVVLDPFLGSGTTALAAEMEGFEWIGIEREAEYVAIAEARLNGTQRGLGLEVG